MISLAEQIINKEIYIQGKGEHAFDFVGGVICISTPSLQSASAIISYPMYDDDNAKVLNIGSEVFIEGNDATANKFAAWRENDKCYLRNNFNSGITFYYTEIAVNR